MQKMNLEYHIILNKTYLEQPARVLREQIYVMWKDQWESIYAQQGSTHVPTADDFVRHDIFTVLVCQSRVIGFSAHSFLDLKDTSTYDRDYFAMFGRSYAAALEKIGIDQVMSYESIIIHPDFRHNIWKMPLSRLLIRINSYLFDDTSAQAIIAVVRKDNGLSAGLDGLGWRMIENDKNCRGFPCDLRVLVRDEHLLPTNDKVEPDALNLWHERIVHRGSEFFTVETKSRTRQAA
jgi:hypothetical protein